MIIYDCEIKKCIPQKSDNPVNPYVYNYCKGWGDFSGMGISCIVTYNTLSSEYKLYMDDNIHLFANDIIGAEGPFIGFNNAQFDNPLIASCVGKEIGDYLASNCYDIMRNSILGFDPSKVNSKKIIMKGFSLNNFSNTNLGSAKTGSGELAPMLYQKGKIADLVNYCMMDVKLTLGLVRLIRDTGHLKHPNIDRATIKMRPLIGERVDYLHLL